MLLAFICSEFSLSHYLPKVRFPDTAAACLALHPGNYLPGNLSQKEISCLWHQGGHRHQQSPCLAPSPPSFATPFPSTALSKIRVARCDLCPGTSKVLSHCTILIELLSQTHHNDPQSYFLLGQAVMSQTSHFGLHP